MESLDKSRCSVLAQAIEENIVSDNEPNVLFFDLDYFEKVLTKFQEAFATENVKFLHCFAVKAAPFPKLMQRLPSLNFGAEAASLTEVEIALRNGVEASNIIWDSPCKTVDEIRFGIERKVNMNADNGQELVRMDEIINALNLPEDQIPKYLGIRLNPCVGFGERTETSTSDLYSKFGLPMTVYKEEIIKFFETYKWLNTLHFHIGSQAFGISALVEAVKKVVDLAEEINLTFDEQKIKALDIGGGLPTLYDSDDYEKHLATFPDFVNQIKQNVPELLSGKYIIMSENGRTFTTKSGFAVGRIEYTKTVNDLTIVIQHIGADLLLRTCYLPEAWPLRMFVCNPDGSFKESSGDDKEVVCDVAGPLCFGGDKIARSRKLVNPQPGDWLIVCDTGGYTVGMWSRHCSRPVPAVYEFRRLSADKAQFALMKKKETIEEVISFYE